MKLSSINRLINPVWIKREVKVGDIVKYYRLEPTIYYCRVIETDGTHCQGHFVKDLKDIDIDPGLNDGMVPIEYVEVLL